MAGTGTTLFLCGDVMTGRGIDQLFAQSSDPTLREPYLDDAREYVALAEELSGPIRRPVSDAYVWGDALEALERAAPSARIVNLETSVTTSDDFWPGKGIHYRMHPANLGCLTVARLDVAVLANNHLLDFGRAGLTQTLRTLHEAGLRTCGAGETISEALAGAWLEDAGVRVYAVADHSSGVEADWAARGDRSGVAYLSDLSAETAAPLLEAVTVARANGEHVLVSIHWGSNWGYAVSDRQVRFAHRLIDTGADLVYGHSSHHPRPIEVYRGRLVLYGCGDFLNDYEGIRGYDAYRGELRLMYLVKLGERGALEGLRMVPFRSERLALRRATHADAQWLAARITESSERLGARARTNASDELELAWTAIAR